MPNIAALNADPSIRRPGTGMLFCVTPEGHAVLRVHATADPDKRSEEWRTEKRKQFLSDAFFRQEIDLDHYALTGSLVFPEYDESIHVIPHEAIPREMTMYCSIDPHPRTPTAVLWLGVDQWEDMYVYREMWPSNFYAQTKTPRDGDDETKFNYKDYCGAIAWYEGNRIDWQNPNTPDCYGLYAMNGGEKIVERYMDQAGKGFIATKDEDSQQSIADTFAQFGIECADPVKRHRAGYDAVHEALEPRHHNQFGQWPRLHFSSNVHELRLEMRRHRYKGRKAGSLQDEELWQRGVKARRHMIDNLRYLLTAEPRYISSMTSRRAN
ncbi:MAG: hypothetical protein GY906_22505 [bacterium]|nr:hypothetical protein [bacterium]